MALIVTCARRRERAACDEAARLLARMGDPGARAEPTPLPGVAAAETSLDPIAATGMLRGILRDEPWEVRHVLRAVPVQRWVAPEAGAIVDAAAELAAAGIPPGSTYRVSVERRGSGPRSEELVAAIAARVRARVDLGSPSHSVLVQGAGPRAGVAAVPSSCVVSAARERRL